jgi:hypothetical protein
MEKKFTPPTKCRVCGGTMEAGAITTTRDVYGRGHGIPFQEISSSDLWWKVETSQERNTAGKLVLIKPEPGPLTVLHYRCVDCGYLESYSGSVYP